MSILETNLPYFIQSYDQLKQHFEANLDSLTNYEKGKKFADFSRRILPFCETDFVIDCDSLTLRQDSHDGGVDIEGKSEDEQALYIQSKYSILQLDHIDAILSKFQEFDIKNNREENQGQLSLFGREELKPPIYIIVTLSNVNNLLKKYESSNRPSVTFYNKLKDNKRILVIDGKHILKALIVTYKKSHLLPTTLSLKLEEKPLTKNGVYIGIVSARTIKQIYDQHGDSLFLENIRDFLGFTHTNSDDHQKKTVNEAIVATVQNEPDKMLARNNGITFRAESVTFSSETILLLSSASIVNGCQTTMCMLKNPIQEACVLVKIVATDDSWDIARAANFQNEVKQIKLELASCIRPQVIKGAISRQGSLKIESLSKSAFDVLDSIYESTVAYDGIYSIFSGLFSTNSSNIINASYADLKTALLEEFYQYEHKDRIFEILFEVYMASEYSMQELENSLEDEKYNQLLQRFWKGKNYSYKAFLTILTLCGLARKIIYDKNTSITKLSELNDFLNTIKFIIENEKIKFSDYYFYSFMAVGNYLFSSKVDQNIDTITRDMNRKLRSANFEILYEQVNFNLAIANTGNKNKLS
jgi:hypothetical protein